MSLAMGIMISYGSYVKNEVSLGKSVNQIEIFDTIIAVLAGFMIVPAVYVFSGEENAIRKIYYEKIAELRGKLKYIETVKDLFKELEKKSLFKVNVTYVLYT